MHLFQVHSSENKLVLQLQLHQYLANQNHLPTFYSSQVYKKVRIENRRMTGFGKICIQVN